MENFADQFLRGASRAKTDDLRTSVRHFEAMLAEPVWQTRVIRLKDCTVRVTRPDMQRLVTSLRAMLVSRANSGADR